MKMKVKLVRPAVNIYSQSYILIASHPSFLNGEV
jgi:hypothetical protein